jgi:hypothetical protein
LGGQREIALMASEKVKIYEAIVWVGDRPVSG